LAKKRVIKNFDALPEEIVELVKAKYPTGAYAEHLVSYTDKEGKKVSALPFETDDTYYLIRLAVQEVKKPAKEDDDLDDESPAASIRSEFAEIATGDEFDGEGEDDDDLADGSADEDDHIIVTRRRDEDDDRDVPDDSEY